MYLGLEIFSVRLALGLEQYNLFVFTCYLVGPFYAGPNSTPALIPPPQEYALTPFRAAFYAGQRPRKEKI